MSRTATTQIRRILVPVDGSDGSKRACATAKAIAKAASAEIEVLNVLRKVAPMYDEHFEKDANALVQSAVSDFKSVGVKATGEVIRYIDTPGEASVVEKIVQIAEEDKADLIVLGSRGLGGFKRLLLGSVSSGVTQHAHCSVLVVR